MDRISELPDAVLLKILALLSTKDVVTTMVLSKRWQFLWMLVPRLEYSYEMYQDGRKGRFLRFVYSSLLLHEAPVLESFSLKLGSKCGAIDIGVCVKHAVSRSVRKLNIEIDRFSSGRFIIPRSLYTGCRMFVTLTLDNAALVGDVSLPVSFSSLKTLSLSSMKYPGDDFLCNLLSSCPVLEDLYVEQCRGDNLAILVVRVASLKVLTVRKYSEVEYHKGIIIDAPSLEFLNIVDYTDGFCIIESNMPKIQDAHLDVTYSHPQQLLGSLTSLLQLSLCFATPVDPYLDGTIFNRLEQLKLCICETGWLALLMRLLKDSPKLRLLMLVQSHDIKDEDLRPCWKKPSQVPQCLLSSLEIFEWRRYEGRVEDKEVATFILRNSRRLEMATFYPNSKDPVMNLKMLMDLSMSPRGSSICQLEFHGNYNPLE